MVASVQQAFERGITVSEVLENKRLVASNIIGYLDEDTLDEIIDKYRPLAAVKVNEAIKLNTPTMTREEAGKNLVRLIEEANLFGCD